METSKRTYQESSSYLLEDIESVILDIEGTTTPISFVKDTLFPYARDNVESYITKNYDADYVQKAISALRDLAKKDSEDKVEGVIEIPGEDASKEDIIKAVVDNAKWQMDLDRKSTELKSLQGLIWKVAYEDNEVKGELFDDVAPMLKMLVAERLKLYIFSSGSVEAQKLLFKHSNYGDLSGLFTNFYDTNIGPKTEKSSYEKIAHEIGKKPALVLFLTDNPKEAEASHAAGMRCALVIRQGNEELTDEHLQKFACIERFDELYGDEEDEEDIKRFAGDNGEADDDDDDDDDEVDEDDDDVENEEDDENPEEA